MLASSSSPQAPTSTSTSLAIGCDHAAYPQKAALLTHLKDLGHSIIDCGTDSQQIKCDYPDFAESVCLKVTSGQAKAGILLCGTGIGMSIAANKIKGIRCALCHDHYTAQMARKHNDANVLAVGARVTGLEVIKQIADTFLSMEFSTDPKHAKRLAKIPS